MTDARRRDMVAQAQRAYRRKRIFAHVKPPFLPERTVELDPPVASWRHLPAYQADSGTTELRATIQLPRLPRWTRRVTVAFEDL